MKTKTMISELRWNVIGTKMPEKAGGYAVGESGVDFAGKAILMALDGIGQRHLLIPVPAEKEIREDRKSGGVHVISHELTDKSGRFLFVDLVCRKQHLNEVFTVLANEVIEQLYASGTKDPDITCCTVLDKWRELLGSRRSELLGLEALTGLFGEFLCLERMASSYPDVLDVWVGPEGHRHDFVREDTSLEVKTSLIRNGRLFEIHGHQQLEPVEGGTLFFSGIKVERAPESGRSVPDVIEAVAKLGVPYAELGKKLLSAGYDVSKADEYRKIRFSVIENRTYLVDSGFPRITSDKFCEGELPSGVTRVNYVVDLTGEPPTPLAEDQIDKMYKRLAGVE